MQVSLKLTRLSARFGPSLLTIAMVVILTGAISGVSDVIDLRDNISVFLIPVTVAAVRWNLFAGLVAALSGILCVGFFFDEPRFSFRVDSPEDIAELIMFSAVAVIISYLANARASKVASNIMKGEQARPLPTNGIFGIPENSNPQSVPEKVTGFLIKQGDRMNCDSCVQKTLDMKWRQQVQLVTGTLAATGLFQRETARCSTCGDVKQVTRLRFSPSRLANKR